jgi:hypothetical protein
MVDPIRGREAVLFVGNPRSFAGCLSPGLGGLGARFLIRLGNGTSSWMVLSMMDPRWKRSVDRPAGPNVAVKLFDDDVGVSHALQRLPDSKG